VFEITDNYPEALTFDDVSLIPSKSDIIPKDTDLKTYFSRHIRLNIPFSSAAMDTVTESGFAIEIGFWGGIGIIHKNMSIEKQTKEVQKVKYETNLVVENPKTVAVDMTISNFISYQKKKNFSRFPVYDNNNKVVGIVSLSNCDYQDNNLMISDVMTKDVVFVNKSDLLTNNDYDALKVEKSFIDLYKKNHKKTVLVLNNEGGLEGIICKKDIDLKTSKPFANKDEHGKLIVGAAVGVGKEGFERARALVESDVDVLVVDSAHGHSKNIIETVRELKKSYGTLVDVVAGNVVTYDAAMDLIDAGADAIKVGIGPGSICTTRVISGAGIPQITAIRNVYEATKGTDVRLIADGGLKYSGDIVKAISAGADCIMAGFLFAGCEETPGEIIFYEGKTYKDYRGMGSESAMKQGSKDRYFQDDVEDEKKLVPEGMEGRVEYKGHLKDILYQLVGGLRSGMGYCGTKTISELKGKNNFVKVTNAGQRESHPHDVQITKDASNYQRHEG
jgi:IMP dehydrogenase